MRKQFVILVTGLALVLASTTISAKVKKCDEDSHAGEVCHINVKHLKPTQYSVGMVAAECKRREIEAKTASKLKQWLEKDSRQVPAVIGPDGEFYITDRHHLSVALYGARPDKDRGWGNKQKRLRVKVLKSYADSDISTADFWNQMLEQKWAWLHDQKGLQPMNPRLLPRSLGDLLNDPYRTLSRWVRESCGYVKAGKEQCDDIRPGVVSSAPYFMEFYWADYMREAVPLKTADKPVCTHLPYSDLCLGDEVAELEGVYQKAMTAVASPAARAYLKQQGLDPVEYGYNTGARLGLSFDEPGCEVIHPR